MTVRQGWEQVPRKAAKVFRIAQLRKLQRRCGVLGTARLGAQNSLKKGDICFCENKKTARIYPAVIGIAANRLFVGSPVN